MSVLNDITDYIEFLRNCGYGISLSCFFNKFEPYTQRLLEYEIHTHSVCSYLKSNKSTMGKCQANKMKLGKVTFSGTYYSCCYAGVEEYVIPVTDNEIFLMCINVSGYRDNLQLSKERKNKIAKLCDQRFHLLYSELLTNVPTENEVMRFIAPLKYMIKELYRECCELQRNSSNSATKIIYLEAIRYIHENFMNSISCKSIANHINYSVSYLRYIFKKEGRCSVIQCINEIRLEKARGLLMRTSLSVTDIALNCGFGDSNYFSTAFKRKYGVSPTGYKKVAFGN